MTLAGSEHRQQPNRSELVTFGKPYQDVLPSHLARLGVKRVYLVISKSLANSSSELQTIQKAIGDKLAGTRIGVGPHG
jgi:maleylacetate reductase